MDLEKFLQLAKLGVVTVEFKRVDTGEIRIMPCTLNPSLCNIVGSKPFPISIANQSSSSDYICVWAIDRGEWRDFKVDTVIRWYSGY